VRHYATATIARERLGLVWPPRYEQRLRAEFAAMRQSLGDAAFEAAWADGQRCEVEEAIHRALTIFCGARQADKDQSEPIGSPISTARSGRQI